MKYEHLFRIILCQFVLKRRQQITIQPLVKHIYTFPFVSINQRVGLVHKIDIGIDRLLVRKPGCPESGITEKRDKGFFRPGAPVFHAVRPCQQNRQAVMGKYFFGIDPRQGTDRRIVDEVGRSGARIAVQLQVVGPERLAQHDHHRQGIGPAGYGIRKGHTVG